LRTVDVCLFRELFLSKGRSGPHSGNIPTKYLA